MTTLQPRARAFTLIELLIVVAIIAILAAIAVPNFLEAQVRSKVSRVKSDVRSLVTALESYRVDANRYPPGWVMIGNPSINTGDDRLPLHPRNIRLFPLTTPVAYITSIPLDPFYRDETGAAPAGENVYAYWPPLHFINHKPGGDFGTPNALRDFPDEQNNKSAQRWAILSAGPLQPDPEPDDHETASPNTYMANYDPTNGSVSPGYVWRFGP